MCVGCLFRFWKLASNVWSSTNHRFSPCRRPCSSWNKVEHEGIYQHILSSLNGHFSGAHSVSVRSCSETEDVRRNLPCLLQTVLKYRNLQNLHLHVISTLGRILVYLTFQFVHILDLWYMCPLQMRRTLYLSIRYIEPYILTGHRDLPWRNWLLDQIEWNERGVNAYQALRILWQYSYIATTYLFIVALKFVLAFSYVLFVVMSPPWRLVHWVEESHDNDPFWCFVEWENRCTNVWNSQNQFYCILSMLVLPTKHIQRGASTIVFAQGWMG